MEICDTKPLPSMLQGGPSLLASLSQGLPGEPEGENSREAPGAPSSEAEVAGPLCARGKPCSAWLKGRHTFAGEHRPISCHCSGH